jgi:hypothetical protein
MTFHQVFDTSNMTDVIGGDGTPYLSGSSEFAPGLWDENTL